MSGQKVIQISDNLTFPLEAVTRTFGILATRGVGKTYTASKFTEQVIKAGQQVCVLDPLGVWWGLRSSADGKRPGLPIAVIGGEHGDIPLSENMGEVLANLMVDTEVSVVIDLSALRKNAQKRFATAFAEALYHRNRKPLHIVIDEADLFAPQRPMKDDTRMLGAIEDLVRRGRVRGFGLTLISQRSSVLNKNVLEMIDVLIAMRTGGPLDQEALDAWIKHNHVQEKREVFMSSLSSLPVGTAWVWSPGWLGIFQQVKIARKETFDSSATPKVGEKRHTPKAIARIDIEMLRETLSASVAEIESNDPRKLKLQIAQLQRQLNEKPKASIQIKEVPIIPAEDIERLEQLGLQAREHGQALIEYGNSILERVKGAVSVAPQMAQRQASSASPTVTATRSRQNPAANPAPPPAPVNPAGNDDQAGAEEKVIKINAGAIRILNVLAARSPMRFTRHQLASLSGFSPDSGTYGTYLSSLRKAGYINGDNSGLYATDQGIDFAGVIPPNTPTTTDEVVEMWRQNLTGGAARMFDVLVNLYPNWISRQELGEQVGMSSSSGTFGTYLSMLSSNGLLEKQGSDLRVGSAIFI